MLAEFERAAESCAAQPGAAAVRGRVSQAHRARDLLAMFNQLSGINAILYYLNDIFAAAGFSGLSQRAAAVAIGAANLIATMIALRVIDRVGPQETAADRLGGHGGRAGRRRGHHRHGAGHGYCCS